MKAEQKYPLATKSGIEALVEGLILAGSMCPECGYATRKTSKNWRICKRCNTKIKLYGK